MNVGRSIRMSILVLAIGLGLQACASSGPRVSSEEAAQANLNLGVGYLRQGRPDLAVTNLERALEQNPRLAGAHSSLALAHDQLGNMEEAEEHYRRAAQLASTDPTVANLYGVFLCRQNRWGDAEPYFQRAVNNPSYPTPAAALTNAGLCAASAGEVERAEEYLRAALMRDPAFPDALGGMLELAYRQQNYLQARAFLQRYLDAQPATATVLYMCFNVERELGDRDAAERCARQLREEFPQSPELAQVRQLQRDGQ